MSRTEDVISDRAAEFPAAIAEAPAAPDATATAAEAAETPGTAESAQPAESTQAEPAAAESAPATDPEPAEQTEQADQAEQAEQTDQAASRNGFDALALDPLVRKVLGELGYENPSPIQAQTIPPLLDGHDVMGLAQTGTGKTAAFALPILSRIDLDAPGPQALVLAPTRELAIQVAEAFERYAKHLPGFHVLPIYGGQSYGPQLAGLKRGAHVVVGTPGRLIDHLDKGSLNLLVCHCASG